METGRSLALRNAATSTRESTAVRNSHGRKTSRQSTVAVMETGRSLALRNAATSTRESTAVRNSHGRCVKRSTPHS
ncbi:Hypothetical protein SMAX5B_002291 [Scophthalmus maximus]|uniref:Uncharacterized protein n=1 Tax=Scophthalmus maximus TaxID=52904 RepID=A0A2U9BGC8_SCOMX|nr:Hypothetical protein SMAX5B_002291 [Scophthalmus maximus]